MKKIFSVILPMLLLVTLFSSCEKDENRVVMRDVTNPTLTASPLSIVLSSTTAADTVETFSWTASEYGFDAAVSYTLQLAKAGTSFATPKEVTTGSVRMVKYTGAELNQIALLQGLSAGNAGQLEVRVKSTLSDSIRSYSPVITLNVTPYLVIINYPSLWVPGEYQSWTPATAEKISSKLSNGIYEGYVNFATGGMKFKYTSHPDWDHTAYGWASSTTTGQNVSGTFSTSGGDLFVPSLGYYLLKGNTGASTWSATRINSWGMIGDFNSWSGDAPMTYNTTTKVWTGTLTAPANGIFKFRANADWGINFGDTDADRSLEYDGKDIAVTAGTHTVTLDLSVPGNYTYKIQ